MHGDKHFQTQLGTLFRKPTPPIAQGLYSGTKCALSLFLGCFFFFFIFTFVTDTGRNVPGS